VSDAAVRAEAELAALQLAEKIGAAEFAAVEPVLKRLASDAASDAVRARAQALLKLLNSGWVYAGPYRQEGKEAMQARLSLVSPYRSTFVFSSRKGQKVAEYSLYQVTSYLRAGRLARLQETPLFDRAFGNIVSLLRGGPDPAA
jgi:hypothetical protein